MLRPSDELIRDRNDRINAMVPCKLDIALHLVTIELCPTNFGLHKSSPLFFSGCNHDKAVGSVLGIFLPFDHYFGVGVDDRPLSEAHSN